MILSSDSKTRAGQELAGLALLLLLAQFGVHFWRPANYPLEVLPLGLTFALGWVGTYLISPTAAEDGGGFLVRSTVSLIRSFRTGQGDTAQTTTTAEVTTTEQVPVAASVPVQKEEPPAMPPQVAWEHGVEDGVI